MEVPTGNPKEKPLVFDDEGFVLSTWEYCLMGEKEGWLTRTGWHRERDIVYFHFQLV